jgi:RNA-binding protein
MPVPLTTRERETLKSRAHSLEPVLQVGQAGLSDALVSEIARALTAHELIKVRILDDDRESRVAIGDAICERTDAAAVQRVGKVLVLWRPKPKDAE